MLISEFFYVAGGICCVLYFTYERDEQAVAKYIADIMRELNQDVEGKPVQRSLEDQLENCETISRVRARGVGTDAVDVDGVVASRGRGRERDAEEGGEECVGQGG